MGDGDPGERGERRGEAAPFINQDDGSSSPNFESMSVSHREEKAFPTSIEQFQLLGSQFLQSVNSKTNGYRPRWSPPTSRHILHLAQRFGSFLIPSFWRTSQEPAKDLHETAYLDGLRGYACYAVFFSHHTTAYCYEVWHMYGEGNNPHFVQTHYFFQLPIIRLMVNGQAAIAIFFVLSGYVLSYKPLRLIHSHDFEKLQSCLASSIFRRWIRLFLPVAALWVVNFWLVEFGAFAWFDNYRIDHPKMPPGIIEEYMSHKNGFWSTAAHALWTFWDYCQQTLFVWNKNGFLPEVDGHTWTLHTEFRSSCILFLFLHGTSRMVPNLRFAFFWLCTAVCLYWDQWAIGTFLAGSAIADLDLRMRRRQGQPQPASMERPEYHGTEGATQMEIWQGRLKDWLIVNSKQLSWGLLFFSGLLLLSYPNTGANQVFFYAFLSRWGSPQAWDFFYWMAIGAMMLVISAGRVRGVQRVLEWRFSQYIGKTSFALYLVHGTVIKSLGHFVVIQTWAHITGYHGWGYALGIVLPLVFVVGPVTIVAADWFWRGADIPSVRFGRWLEDLVLDKTI